MNESDREWQDHRRQQIAKKAAELGITPDEYASRLACAGANQREWLASLNALGWDHSKSPTENLERIRIETAMCGV